jgi:hypothetical protein
MLAVMLANQLGASRGCQFPALPHFRTEINDPRGELFIEIYGVRF